MSINAIITVVVLAVLILLMLALVLFVMRVARKRAAEQQEGTRPEETSEGERAKGIQSVFRSAVQLIEANIAPRKDRYSVPWILLIGEPGSGKSTLIGDCGVPAALRPPATPLSRQAGLGWHFFDRGVVIDVKGERVEGDNSGGEGEGERTWNALLRQAQRYRPQRPIDSVIVTIPAQSLLDTRPGALEALVRKGELIHRRLWQAQRQFGIRLAVYLVVTKCDELEGFTAFTRALPEALRTSMVGWSTPYDLEAVYREQWTDEAIASMRQSISGTQDELMAGLRTVEDADSFVLLPAQVGALRDGMHAYLEQLIRPSAYHESFYLRGVYLTGDGGYAAHELSRLAIRQASLSPRGPEDFEDDEESTAESPAHSRPASLPPKPVFARDLFEHKIFPEFGLSRPLDAQRGSRSRTVRVLQWSTALLALVWSSGMVYYGVSADRRIDGLAQAMNQIGQARAYRRDVLARKGSLGLDWYRQRSVAMLETMSRLDERALWSFFIPGSWPVFDDLPDRVQEQFDLAFADIVLNTIRKGVNTRVSELTGWPRDRLTQELARDGTCRAPQPRIAGVAQATLAIEDVPEFSALQEYVDAIVGLESVIKTYDHMQQTESGALNDFRQLVRYAFGFEVPATSGRVSGYVAVALKNAAKNPRLRLDSTQFESAIRCTASLGVAQLMNRFFLHNDVLVLSKRVDSGLPLLYRKNELSTLDTAQTLQAYEWLRDQLRALSGILRNPRTAWLHRGDLELGPAFNALLLRFSDASLLGEVVRDNARGRAQSALAQLQQRVSGISSDVGAAILQRDAESRRWQLSPEMASLESGLSVLLSQSFMSGNRGRRISPAVADEGRILWDVKLLDQGIELTAAQRRYLAELLPKLPARVHANVRKVVNRQLALRMVDYVVDAQSVPFRQGSTGQSDLAASTAKDILNFDNARPRLVRILAALGEIGADAEYAQLLELVSRDAIARLRSVDEALNQSQFYSVKDGDFSWWQGGKGFATEAFGVADTEALGAYLAQQLARIEVLSKMSEPLVALLENAQSANTADALGMLERWRLIRIELERYKAKNPNSSVSSLEAFIRAKIGEIDLNNCLDKTGQRSGAAPSSDYFQERRTALLRHLNDRCYALKSRESNDAYRILQAHFNRSLSGRFPFGSGALEGTASEPRVAEVVDYLLLHNRYAKPALDLMIDRPLEYGRGGSAQRFLEQMGRAREFFAPLLPGKDGAPGAGYDVTVDFRVNKAAEVDGNKIVDWSLQVGDKTVRLRDKNRQMRWRVGMEVKLTLRWAKDATTVPVADARQKHLELSDHTVVYNYPDPWGLLKMIRQHQSTSVDGVSAAELRPHTLKFEFPVRSIVQGLVPRADSPTRYAKVFVRVVISAAGNKKILVLPALPERAPDLATLPVGAVRDGMRGPE